MYKATIYDVAAKAGVSISTVSLALNSPEKVKAETLERIFAAVSELDYVPKAEAAARARRGTGRIGVIAPFTAYPSFYERLRGVLEGVHSQPYEVVLYDQESASKRHDYLGSLPVTRRLDGIIVMSLPFDDRVTQSLLDHRLETVVIEFDHPEFSSLTIDNTAGGRMVARYFADKGHKRCAFVGEEWTSSALVAQGVARLAGYREGLSEVGIDLPEQYMAVGPFGVQEARQRALALLDLPEPPTAIFAHSDIQAVGVMQAARDRGLNIPGDLAIVGFDDSDVAAYMGLTTVHQPLFESGRIAVELLLNRISDQSRPVQHVRLPIHMVERSSA